MEMADLVRRSCLGTQKSQDKRLKEAEELRRLRSSGAEDVEAGVTGDRGLKSDEPGSSVCEACEVGRWGLEGLTRC